MRFIQQFLLALSLLQFLFVTVEAQKKPKPLIGSAYKVDNDSSFQITFRLDTIYNGYNNYTTRYTLTDFNKEFGSVEIDYNNNDQEVVIREYDRTNTQTPKTSYTQYITRSKTGYIFPNGIDTIPYVMDSNYHFVFFFKDPKREKYLYLNQIVDLGVEHPTYHYTLESINPEIEKWHKEVIGRYYPMSFKIKVQTVRPIKHENVILTSPIKNDSLYIDSIHVEKKPVTLPQDEPYEEATPANLVYYQKFIQKDLDEIVSQMPMNYHYYAKIDFFVNKSGVLQQVIFRNIDSTKSKFSFKNNLLSRLQDKKLDVSSKYVGNDLIRVNTKFTLSLKARKVNYTAICIKKGDKIRFKKLAPEDDKLKYSMNYDLGHRDGGFKFKILSTSLNGVTNSSVE